MLPICDGCHKQVGVAQLYSGLQVDQLRMYQGHYACVLGLLGSTLTLRAIQKGLLPLIDVDTLVDGRLPKFKDGIPKPPPSPADGMIVDVNDVSVEEERS